jgi:hypothetical protein
MTTLIIVAAIIAVVYYIYYLSHGNHKDEEEDKWHTEHQPAHFDLLDELPPLNISIIARLKSQMFPHIKK